MQLIQNAAFTKDNVIIDYFRSHLEEIKENLKLKFIVKSGWGKALENQRDHLIKSGFETRKKRFSPKTYVRILKLRWGGDRWRNKWYLLNSCMLGKRVNQEFLASN